MGSGDLDQLPRRLGAMTEGRGALEETCCRSQGNFAHTRRVASLCKDLTCLRERPTGNMHPKP